MKTVLITLAALTLALSASAQTRRGSAPAPRVTSAPTSYSFASNTLHEVVITPSKVAIESYKTAKSRTDVTIYAAYNHHIHDNMQVGGEGGLLVGNDSSGNSKSLVAAMGTFTYNFSSNLREAFFVQGGVGLYPAYDKKDGDTDSKISFFGGGGKRIEMWGKLNYMPYARVWKRGDEDVRFEIQALNFSLFY